MFVTLLVEAVNRERETTEVSSAAATPSTPTSGTTPTSSSTTTSPTHSALPLPEGWAMQVMIIHIMAS